MTYFFSLLLAGLLLLPLTPTAAEARATSTAPQVHVVSQGDTLYEIARRHGLTVNELKRLNGLNSSRLKIGQKLALTRAAAPPLPQAAKATAGKPSAQTRTAGNAVHIVKKGDSLYTIARRHGLTVEQLKNLNALEGSHLKIGQKLALSGQTRQAVSEPSSAPGVRAGASSVEQHVVRKGDTLSSIARRYHVSVNELKRLNGLRSTRLNIGQRLALAEPYDERSPLLLPGDTSEDEVLEMAYSANSELEQAAYGFLSTPYRFGGNSRKGIDCSAFVQQVFREVDVDLPRSAREQYRIGAKVERGDLQPGDLLFFNTYAKFPSHVGIYLGDGKMIHASSRSRRVVVTSIDYPYYRKRFIGAKRISLLDSEETISATGQHRDGEFEETAAPVDITLIAASNGGPATPDNDETTGAVAGTDQPQVSDKTVSAAPASTPPLN